jgi:adenylate kinase family enzyme
MRIIVIGVSASGKTTFTKKLAERMNAKPILMDEIMWGPGWNYIGDEATIEKTQEVIKGEDWLLEGYITKLVRTEVFDRADQILYLDYPGWLSAWRYIKRCIKYWKNPRPELPGSPEKFSIKFLKLVYTKGETWTLEQLLEENNWNEKIVRFKRPSDAKNYLANQ